MGCWFRSNLGDAMLAGASLEHVKQLFLSEYEKISCLKERALFVRHESEGRLHCEVIVYFPPATATVATAVHATPCSKPCSDGLSLLAGSEESWLVLFPEKGFKAP